MVQVWAAATSDLCITLIPIKETVWVKCVQQPLPIYGSPLYLLRKKFGSSVCSSQFLFSREAAGAKPVLWSMMFWDQVSSECTACSVIYDVLWSGKQRVHSLFCDLWCSVIRWAASAQPVMWSINSLSSECTACSVIYYYGFDLLLCLWYIIMAVETEVVG